MTPQQKAMLYSPSLLCLPPLLAWAVLDHLVGWVRSKPET